MCLIFIGLKVHPDYPFIIAGNRDEFYNRRTAAADFWPDHPHVLGGRDLEAGGTWLGVNAHGKVSMITNFRDPKNINPAAPSRGHLVSDFLVEPVSAQTYVDRIRPAAKLYNGFNLFIGDTNELFYLSNYAEGVMQLTHGLFGISNHLLDTPWPKITRGKEKMTSILNEKKLSREHLFEVLYDDMTANDDLLPDTGVGLTLERALSAMFIKSPGYGTRCSTVILVDNSRGVSFTERVYDPSTFAFNEKTFNFRIS